MLHCALYRPEIPPNTGNIGRLCVGMGAHLHLIGPCAFDLDDRRLRRAGLDYWPNLSWTLHEDESAFIEWLGDRRPWLISKHGQQRFDQAPFQDDDVLLLGNELRGLPPHWHRRSSARSVYIPITGPVRSYNLANAAAIVLAHASARAGRFDAKHQQHGKDQQWTSA